VLFYLPFSQPQSFSPKFKNKEISIIRPLIFLGRLWTALGKREINSEKGRVNSEKGRIERQANKLKTLANKGFQAIPRARARKNNKNYIKTQKKIRGDTKNVDNFFWLENFKTKNRGNNWRFLRASSLASRGLTAPPSFGPMALREVAPPGKGKPSPRPCRFPSLSAFGAVDKKKVFKTAFVAFIFAWV
jgi:hypothetical protein